MQSFSTDENKKFLQRFTSKEEKDFYINDLNELKSLPTDLQIDEVVCCRLGESLFNLRKYKSAVEFFSKSIEIKPCENAFIKLSLCYCELKQFEKAVKTLEKGIIYFEESADLYTHLGLALRSAYKTSEAIEAFETALNKNHEHFDANFGLGVTFGMTKNFNKAIKYLTNAIKIKPLFPPAHFQRALYYISLQDVESAEAELELLKSLDPSYAAELKKEIDDFKNLNENSGDQNGRNKFRNN